MTPAPPPDDQTDPLDPSDPGRGPGDTDLALYALGALDDTELRTVETRLATDADAARVEGRLRRVAGSMAAVADGIDTAPPLDLRDRVLAAARAERAPSPVEPVPMPPAELHRIEGERLLELVRSLHPHDWDALVDPPEFAGWTVRDLIAHITTIEAYAAAALGVTDPVGHETQASNEERTHHAIARHRALGPAETVAELESFIAAVDDAVTDLDDAQPVRWWALDLPLRQVLVVRTFELWTHAADIARAIGRPEPIPSAPALRTMSDLATGWTALMSALSGELTTTEAGPDAGADPDELTTTPAPGWVRLVLTGPGGATHDVSLDPDVDELIAAAPIATITLDIIDYCRGVANRAGPDGVPYECTGDAAVAAAVIVSLPALAVL